MVGLSDPDMAGPIGYWLIVGGSALWVFTHNNVLKSIRNGLERARTGRRKLVTYAAFALFGTATGFCIGSAAWLGITYFHSPRTKTFTTQATSPSPPKIDNSASAAETKTTPSKGTDKAVTPDKPKEFHLGKTRNAPLATPPQVIIQTATPYGNLQQRAINLAQEIMDELYRHGLPDGRPMYLGPSPGIVAVEQKPRNGPAVAEWDSRRSRSFRMRRLDNVRELRDEFAQLHLRDRELDDFLKEIETSAKANEAFKQAGANVQALDDTSIQLMDMLHTAQSLQNLARQLADNSGSKR
jgi:hypothetical protein